MYLLHHGQNPYKIQTAPGYYYKTDELLRCFNKITTLQTFFSFSPFRTWTTVREPGVCESGVREPGVRNGFLRNLGVPQVNGLYGGKSCILAQLVGQSEFEANPQVYVETPLHLEKLTVWCALWAGGIIGPYFFQNDEGHNVTVNGDRYIAMITIFFIPELNNHDVQELWFQQDGATRHTARATIDLLKDTFDYHLISRFGPVNWPPRSCDLTPLDYFLWGYVKSLVYADKPQTLDHLEDNIRRVIADIRPQKLGKVIENWTSRLDYIRASRGSHMPEIVFKIIIGRLECGHTQLEVSKELGIAQSVISRLRQRFKDDGNVSRCYSTGRPRVTTPNEDRKICSYCQKKQTEHSIRPVSSALFQLPVRQFQEDHAQTLRHIGLYARRPIRCVPLTATQCHLRLT
ncbi:uncharacterized protein TNCV_1195041 [Trichonephila clavipes]|nr:uncharacterized protein TNCV_1195041 [Trichonephila clavipes]